MGKVTDGKCESQPKYFVLTIIPKNYRDDAKKLLMEISGL